jgi:hypothetical protein
MRFLKILGGIVVVLALLVVILFVGARFHDGPLALIPGGPLVAGELVAEPVADWEFAETIPEIELQLAGDDTSRTVWILVRDGQAYVPASLGFPPGKTWHQRADKDGRTILRIEGKRYPVSLKRIDDAQVEEELKGIASAKYSGGPPGDSEVWFFAVESRAS